MVMGAKILLMVALLKFSTSAPELTPNIHKDTVVQKNDSDCDGRGCPVVKESDLPVKVEIGAPATNFTDGGGGEDGALKILAGSEKARAKKCRPKKKCLQQGGTCVPRWTCVGTVVNGCTKKCDCCIPIETTPAPTTCPPTTTPLPTTVDTTLVPLTTGVPATVYPTCRDGFDYIRGYCWRKEHNGGNWEQCEQVCNNLGTDVTIVTMAQPYTDDLVNWQKAMIEYMGGGYYYVGASRHDDGIWYWLDNAVVKYSAWRDGAPPPASSGGCAWVYYSDGKLRSKDCTDGLTPICQELPTCRNGFDYIRGYCWRKEHNGGNWDQCEQVCNNLGTDVTSVTMAQPYTDDLVNWQKAMIEYMGGGYYYVGASRHDDGIWYWLDGAVVKDSAWRDGAPPPASSGGCAWVYYSDGKLRPKDCTDGLTPICQDVTAPAPPTTSTPLPTIGVICPPQFVDINGHCFYFSSVGIQSWQVADDTCQNFGTNVHLAEVRDPYAIGLMEAIYSKGQWYWLGATDANLEDTWVWVTSGEALPLSSSFWAPYDPNGSNSQNCLRAGPHNTQQSRGRIYFDDYACTNGVNCPHYICQLF